jgi:hypothetical protein
MLTTFISIEWSVYTADESDSSPAFDVTYVGWLNDENNYCSGPSVFVSNPVISGEYYFGESEFTCAYEFSFSNAPEAGPGTQNFPIFYSSDAQTIAISALIMAGLSSIFF